MTTHRLTVAIAIAAMAVMVALFAATWSAGAMLPATSPDLFSNPTVEVGK
jgi:hypothetical protein